MKTPELPLKAFTIDKVVARKLLAEKPGRIISDKRVLSVSLPCVKCDLSAFNQLSMSLKNESGKILYIEVKLFHGSGKTGEIDVPFSTSGGREQALPGKTTEFLFPVESFGTYGKPDGRKNVKRIEILCKREKPDEPAGIISVDMGAIYGEKRLIATGPRLTDSGFEFVQKSFSPDMAVNPPDLLFATSISIPAFHPYPHEGANDVMAGRIMGQNLSELLPWNINPSGIMEWSHFLHRHHFLRSVTKAYVETGNSLYARFIAQIIRDWIVKHPVTVESNGGAGPSWETLSAAWRLIEWLWIKETVWQDPLFDYELKNLMLKSFWEHAHHLMDHEGHPNNWIIVESAALALAGMHLAFFTEAGHWMAKGIKRLEKEFHRQFTQDGAHFELSPLYHAVCLHVLLEVKRVALARNIGLPSVFGTPLEGAADFLASLCRPGFTWPSLNDSGGMAGDYCAVLKFAGELFDRPDLIWFGTGGAEGALPPKENVKCFAEAGIGIMRSGFGQDDHYLVFKAGVSKTTHLHNDVLSIDVAVRGVPCLVDPGITTYAPTKMTYYYRSACAHNTVLIDGKGPSNPQSRFCMTADYNKGISGSAIGFTGSCDGYISDKGDKLVVTRKIGFHECGYWIVKDLVEGEGSHAVTVCWQFAPGQTNIDPCTLVIRKMLRNDMEFVLIPVLGDIMNARPGLTYSCGNIDLPCGWVSMDGSDIPAGHFEYTFRGVLPLELAWILYPVTPGGSFPQCLTASSP